MSNKTPNEVLKYFCVDCNKLFVDLRGLKIHNLQNHKYDTNFPVINCNIYNSVMLGYNANIDLHCKGEIHIKNVKTKEAYINNINNFNIGNG